MGYSRFINVPLQARGWVCETGARIEEAKLPIFGSIRLFSVLRRFPRPRTDRGGQTADFREYQAFFPYLGVFRARARIEEAKLPIFGSIKLFFRT